ncbi:MAG: SDR family oxidoreductase [Porticoccaceae bacterium]
MQSLTNKVAIVTGASKGIGRGIGIALAARDCRVVLASRDQNSLQAVADEITASGGVAHAVAADVASEEAVSGLFGWVQQHCGQLDILVNNAGIAVSGHIDDISLADWLRVQAVNVTGMFLCSRAAATLMKPRGSGKIINIGSISGQMPRVKSTPYTTSKFAVAGFTKALALELRPFNIAVSCVHPGNVMTDIWTKSPQVAEREGVMTVEDIADVVVTVASLPDNVNMLETVILPVSQPYLGRG